MPEETSDKVLVRIPRESQRLARIAAATAGITQEQWIAQAIAEKAQNAAVAPPARG